MYLDVLSLTLRSFFLFQHFSLDNTLHYIHGRVSLNSSLAGRVSQTFFAFDDLVSFKDYWSGIFVYYASVGICLMSFSCLDLGNVFWGCNPRDKVPSSSQNVKGVYYQYDLPLLLLPVFISQYCCSKLPQTSED